MKRLVAPLLFLLLTASRLTAGVEKDLALLRAASGTAAASAETQAAWDRLAAGGPAVMPQLLAAMKDAQPVAQNWLRACFDAAAERSVDAGDFPMLPLTTFLYEQNNAPRARRTAFEWITRVDPSQKASLLEGMLDDQSLSIRYDAVAQLIAKAEAAGDDASKKATYQRALASARDLKQLEAIADELNKLGEEIDLPAVMGFLKEWQIIGPFDNTGLAHFDTAYPPEKAQAFDKQYEGKLGPVAWQKVTAQGEGGEVDFIAPLGKEKEAIAYAFATFTAPAREAELRYQSKNATKVWLNGKLIASNEVYHSGGGIDMYRATVQLAQGENTVLVKACQNEQKMPWEREWDFRLRVVDKTGTPVATQAAPRVSLRPGKRDRE